MRKLPRKTDNALHQVLEDLDHLMLVERHRTMAARALSEVSWRVYELRRAIAKEIRADGGSWSQVGATMGISRQSARIQWHTVDGELGLPADPDPRATAAAEAAVDRMAVEEGLVQLRPALREDFLPGM